MPRSANSRTLHTSLDDEKVEHCDAVRCSLDNMRSIKAAQNISRRKPVVVEQIGYRAYAALVGKRVVGQAFVWNDSDNRFVILDVFVRPAYRRRGIATALYRRIEADAGKNLVPAISLSDDGFEFWKRYRPEAVKDSLRHRRAELEGRRVIEKGRLATIVTVGSGVVIARYDDNLQTTTIPARLLDEMLIPTFIDASVPVPGHQSED